MNATQKRLLARTMKRAFNPSLMTLFFCFSPYKKIQFILIYERSIDLLRKHFANILLWGSISWLMEDVLWWKIERNYHFFRRRCCDNDCDVRVICHLFVYVIICWILLTLSKFTIDADLVLLWKLILHLMKSL